MTKKKVYFPPTGFGLWFQLGVLHNLKEEECEFFGGSGGAITCLLAISRKKTEIFPK